MKIVLYEDTNDIARKIIAWLQKNYPYDVVRFSSEEEILQYIATNEEPTMYLLDILVGSQTSGLRVSEEIAAQPNSDISVVIFITQYPKEILMSTKHKLLACNTIFKQNKNFFSELRETIIYAVSLFENSVLEFKDKYQYLSIPKKEIIFITTSKNWHKLVIYGNNGNEYIVNGILNDVEERLKGSYFFRCHRLYLVNTRKIHNINKAERKIVFNNCPEICFYTKNKQDQLLKLCNSSV